MSKNFDETVRLQSEIRREWIREVGVERLQGIAESASSAPRLASSSTASFLLLLLVTRPLPRDGGMADDHGAQKPGNSPGPGPEVVEIQRVAKG